jgi:hypothetical protein
MVLTPSPTNASDDAQVDGLVTIHEPTWHNTKKPCDVNGNGSVTPLDVLLVINYINAHPGDSSLPPLPIRPPPYLDVNNDNACTPADVLEVINCINGDLGSSGEGEAAVAGAPAVPPEARSELVLPPAAWHGEAGRVMAVAGSFTVKDATPPIRAGSTASDVGSTQFGVADRASARPTRWAATGEVLDELQALARGRDALWQDLAYEVDPLAANMDAVLQEIALDVGAAWHG